jgi:hypothetical protein
MAQSGEFFFFKKNKQSGEVSVAILFKMEVVRKRVGRPND